MGEIVYIENDRVVTDSLMVAEVFNKDHKHVLRDVREQIEKLKEAKEDEFSQTNFGQSDYKNERGRVYQKYLLTEDAFTLVTMSYNTVEAMKIKVRYINEFNRMKQLLGSRNVNIPMTYPEALRLAADKAEENEKLKKENLILLPKAEVYNQIADSTNFVAVNKVAKNIGIGEIKFFEFLRCVKVFFKEGTINLPMQQYQNKGLFDVKIKTTTDFYNRIHTQYTIKVSGKGELFLVNKVNKYGGAKKINNLKMNEINTYIKEIDAAKKKNKLKLVK
jgi:Rha family phage regulatory protein